MSQWEQRWRWVKSEVQCLVRRKCQRGVANAGTTEVHRSDIDPILLHSTLVITFHLTHSCYISFDPLLIYSIWYALVTFHLIHSCYIPFLQLFVSHCIFEEALKKKSAEVTLIHPSYISYIDHLRRCWKKCTEVIHSRYIPCRLMLT